MTSNMTEETRKKNEIDKSGAYIRQENEFNVVFGNGEGELPVEAGRYRILVSPICGWCQRQLIVRELLGLQNVISVGTAHPVRTKFGRDFKKGWNWDIGDTLGIDPNREFRYLDEAYEASKPGFKGRATVPAVYDLKEHRIVTNDFHNMTYFWEEDFQEFHKKDAPDLLPADLKHEIKEFNNWLFDNVNNGVYKAGFATSQEVYEKEYDNLFFSLDKLEKRLSESRYLFGDQITDSDIRFYTTLVRFDVSYYQEFNCNRNRIIDFENIWNYSKELYQLPAFKRSTDFEGIKLGYVRSKGELDRIIPKGPDTSIWNDPHNRNLITISKIGR